MTSGSGSSSEPLWGAGGGQEEGTGTPQSFNTLPSSSVLPAPLAGSGGLEGFLSCLSQT